MENMFGKVVEQIFNNWTALKLAVDHSMGGSNSKQIANDTVNYIIQYCSNDDTIEAEDIEDTLEDIMDQEFNTVCEDNSIKEISCLLYKFKQILKNGDIAQYESEFNKLPNNNAWLLTPPDIGEHNNILPDSTPSTSSEEIEQDPEWTQVKTRRKRH